MSKTLLPLSLRASWSFPISGHVIACRDRTDKHKNLKGTISRVDPEGRFSHDAATAISQ